MSSFKAASSAHPCPPACSARWAGLLPPGHCGLRCGRVDGLPMPGTAYRWGAQGVAGKGRPGHQLNSALKDAGVSHRLHLSARRWQTRLSSPIGLCVCAMSWPCILVHTLWICEATCRHNAIYSCRRGGIRCLRPACAARAKGRVVVLGKPAVEQVDSSSAVLMQQGVKRPIPQSATAAGSNCP